MNLFRKTSKSKSVEDTKNLASILLKKRFRIFCLYGELGTGKTTFAKGVARSLKIKESLIKSPTFVLIRECKNKKIKIYHIDLYRQKYPDKHFIHDFLEILKKKDGYIIIEWAEKIKKFLPKKRIDIYFEHLSKNSRQIIYAHPK